ncbi:hypothetical protein M4D55_15715 [Metabacillus idriensis]|uniref:hypothetical protein n=1 Tax=Metabacillus idriensis TaxID=324768 RepID=UPI002040E7E1|nr:hypothetical protein [Metabacillus idriensis]MCM3597222.1 hypothetical protein [Metabacillus idriensis]
MLQYFWMVNNLVFIYKLNGAGWAECHLEINSRKYSFTAGYLTNALGDLLQALLNINPFYTEDVYVKSGSELFWDAEPSRTDWYFRYLGDRKMQLKVTFYEDDNDDENPKIELNNECYYDNFLGEVIGEAEKILREYGIVGYKNMWIEHDFPLSTFLQLKFYLEHRSEFPITKNTISDSEIIKSDIEMELNYLNRK